MCSNCSTKKFLLPSQSSKPLRVCDNCYNLLSSGKVSVDQESKKQASMLISIIVFNSSLFEYKIGVHTACMSKLCNHSVSIIMICYVSFCVTGRIHLILNFK